MPARTRSRAWPSRWVGFGCRPSSGLVWDRSRRWRGCAGRLAGRIWQAEAGRTGEGVDDRTPGSSWGSCPSGRCPPTGRLPAAAEVRGVGKIHDLFAGVGIDVKHVAATNALGIQATTSLLREPSSGLIFVNLVDTDQVYGHRHDVGGFHRALVEIDEAVAEWMTVLRDRRSPNPNPTTGSTRPLPTPTTLASTRHCWPAGRDARGAATMGCWRTWARARCGGSRGARRSVWRGNHL